MKKIAIVFLFFSVLLNVYSQKNPGYLGSKNIFSASTSIFPVALVSFGGLKPNWGINYERCLYRNMSIQLGYAGYTINETADYINSDNHNFGGSDVFVYYNETNGNKSPAHVTGSGKTIHTNLSITLKNYIQRTGAIAPLGYFIGLALQKCSWKFVNSNFAGYYIDNHTTSNTRYELPAGEQPGAQSLTCLSLFFGKKNMLTKNICIAWSLGAGFVVSSTVAKPDNIGDQNEFYSRNDQINTVIRRDVGTKNFMELKFELGYIL